LAAAAALAPPLLRIKRERKGLAPSPLPVMKVSVVVGALLKPSLLLVVTLFVVLVAVTTLWLYAELVVAGRRRSRMMGTRLQRRRLDPPAVRAAGAVMAPLVDWQDVQQDWKVDSVPVVVSRAYGQSDGD